MDSWRLGWDGLQGVFAATIGNICKKPNAADRPSQVITGRRLDPLRMVPTGLALTFRWTLACVRPETLVRMMSRARNQSRGWTPTCARARTRGWPRGWPLGWPLLGTGPLTSGWARAGSGELPRRRTLVQARPESRTQRRRVLKTWPEHGVGPVDPALTLRVPGAGTVVVVPIVANAEGNDTDANRSAIGQHRNV